MKWPFVVWLFVLLVLVGCGSAPPITVDQYQQIESGMSLAQVETIVGSPGEFMGAEEFPIFGKAEAYRWDNPDPDDGSLLVIMTDGVVFNACWTGPGGGK